MIQQCHLDVGQCACCAGPREINTTVVVVCLLGHSSAFDVKPLVTCVAANCGLCWLDTALPHAPHGYLGIWGPGLISMSNISSTVDRYAWV